MKEIIIVVWFLFIAAYIFYQYINKKTDKHIKEYDKEMEDEKFIKLIVNGDRSHRETKGISEDDSVVLMMFYVVMVAKKLNIDKKTLIELLEKFIEEDSKNE